MTDIPENITSLLLGVFGGGGLVALFNYLTNRRKMKAETEKTNVDVALQLRDEAIKEYNTAEEKLRKARALLDEVQNELDHAKKYIDVLQDILRENDIEYPSQGEVIKGEK